MKKNSLILCLGVGMLYFSQGASAAWTCDSTYLQVTAEACNAAGGKDTPDAFLSAYVAAVASKNTNPNLTNYTADSCTLNGAKGAICKYHWTVYGTGTQNNMVTLQKTPDVTCPETLESRGDDSSIVKTGDKYNVVWSVRQVTSDVCHNSCSYLASSATVSTCYRVSGSTDTGFCNFVVGLNSASPSCTAESGYKAPTTGDSLTVGDDSGSGGDGGSDGGSGSDGGTGGNGGSGGSGNNDGDGDDGTSFNGELKFNSPGELDAKSIIEGDKNGLASESHLLDMQIGFNESELGAALNDFNNSILNGVGQRSCPAPTFVVYNQEFRIDEHCELLDSTNGILTIVFMACWSLIAVRIVLSA